MRIEVGLDFGLVPAAEEGVDLEDGQPSLLDAILITYEVIHFVCQLYGVGLYRYPHSVGRVREEIGISVDLFLIVREFVEVGGWLFATRWCFIVIITVAIGKNIAHIY